MKEVIRSDLKERNASKGLANDINPWKNFTLYILKMIKFLLNSSLLAQNSLRKK